MNNILNLHFGAKFISSVKLPDPLRWISRIYTSDTIVRSCTIFKKYHLTLFLFSRQSSLPMRSFFLIISIVLISTYGCTQTDHCTVKAGESVEETLGDSIIYRYPQFTPGRVYFRDGNISRAALNLNFVNGEMQFITPSKDTLAIANEGTIKYITIQIDTFYFDKVYIELVHGNAAAKLGKLEIIKQSDLKKEGAYGQMSSTSSISFTSSFYSNNQSYKLTEKSEITLHKETILFIGDNFNNFQPAVKKNIYKMFNTKISTIEPFIKENKLAIDKEDDLIKLIDFLGKT